MERNNFCHCDATSSPNEKFIGAIPDGIFLDETHNPVLVGLLAP